MRRSVSGCRSGASLRSEQAGQGAAQLVGVAGSSGDTRASPGSSGDSNRILPKKCHADNLAQEMKSPVRLRAASARPDPGVVLARAVLRAAEQLGVRQAQLARILGVSEATVSRLASGRSLAPESKAGELALLFVRVFRSLDALFGGATEQSRLWLTANNTHLGHVPARLLESAAGLVAVVDYLDAMRGRN